MVSRNHYKHRSKDASYLSPKGLARFRPAPLAGPAPPAPLYVWAGTPLPL